MVVECAGGVGEIGRRDEGAASVEEKGSGWPRMGGEAREGVAQQGRWCGWADGKHGGRCCVPVVLRKTQNREPVSEGNKTTKETKKPEGRARELPAAGRTTVVRWLGRRREGRGERNCWLLLYVKQRECKFA